MPVRRPTRSRPGPAALILALVALLLAACTGQGSTPRGSGLLATEPGGAGNPSGEPSEAAPTKLVVGLGYLPSVQFAPFYLADQAGYYDAAGLDVEFQNKIDPDLVILVGQGSIEVGVADGTSVIPAVSRSIPIKYLATIYGTFPSIVFAKKSSGITTAADLRGKKIGIPGKYGSSWIMLQALLKSVGLTPADVQVVEYPDFGQGVAVQQGAVDAATGFANNEPVQLELSGSPAVVLHVDDVVALPGPGLIAGTKAIESKGDAIARFIEATLTAMREIEADPAKGVDAAIVAVPELGAQRETQAAILAATIATWARPGGGPDDYGAIDRTGWQASIDYMQQLGLVPNPITVDDAVSEALLPQG